MKFWTTQSEKVLNLILKNKVYYPDFALSDGLGGNYMQEGYQGMLAEYIQRNAIHCTGLVFGITELEDVPIKTIEQYRAYFSKHPIFLDNVSYMSDDYAVLELDIPEQFDIIPLYFQDFIVISMRALNDPAFRMFVKPTLKECPFQEFALDLAIAQSEGWITREDCFTNSPSDEQLLNKITQAHFHQITLDCLKNIYGTYDFNNDTVIPLGPNAQKLCQLINRE